MRIFSFFFIFFHFKLKLNKMKKWIHWEILFGKTLKKDTKISLGDPISLSRRSAAYWQEQETWVPARIPGACVPKALRFHVPASKKNWDPRACVQKERRFHLPVPKRNGDSTSLRPKWTEILLASSQKELRFYLPTSKKKFYSTCPPPKTPQKLFGLLLMFCCFAAPEKKVFFFLRKLN